MGTKCPQKLAISGANSVPPKYVSSPPSSATSNVTNRHRHTNPGIRCLNHVFQTFEPRTMMQWILIQTCSNAKAKNHAHQSNVMNSYTSGIYLHRVWKIVIFLSDTFIIRYLVRGPNVSIPGLVFPWRAEPTVFLWRLAALHPNLYNCNGLACE